MRVECIECEEMVEVPQGIIFSEKLSALSCPHCPAIIPEKRVRNEVLRRVGE